MAKEKLYEYRRMRSQGAYHYFIKFKDEKYWKHHNWEGPAIEPIEGEECELKKSWYLYGIEFDQEGFSEALSNCEGLPWYKQTGANIRH